MFLNHIAVKTPKPLKHCTLGECGSDLCYVLQLLDTQGIAFPFLTLCCVILKQYLSLIIEYIAK